MSTDTPSPAEPSPPFTERPPATELWRRARQDYLGGDTAEVVAERYGFSVRSVRRRAAVEGWRRVDVKPEVRLDPPPAWSFPAPRNRAQIIEEEPEYEEVAAARDSDLLAMLFAPDRTSLRRYAFKRAAEAAVMNKPAEACAWMRLKQLVERSEDVEDASALAFPPEDHLRASILRALEDYRLAALGPGESDEAEGSDAPESTE